MAREPGPGDTVWFVCEQNDPEQTIHCIAPDLDIHTYALREEYRLLLEDGDEIDLPDVVREVQLQGVVWLNDPKLSTGAC
jgi:hypothetical protein